jgi:DNA primase
MTEPVLNLLQDKGLAFIPSGRDYLIKCLNPEHEDSHPSLRVDKISGVAHCFACGWKRNLFKHYGLITNNPSVRIAKLKQKLQELQLSLFEVPMPKGALPYNQKFRGISTNTLKHFEAFYTHEDETFKDRVVFPIRDITGRVSNFVARHVDVNAKPKYLMKPSGVSIQLYPIKLEKPSQSIILVEGILDMMNMYDKGARNVISIFGLQTLKSNTRVKLLPYKIQGVTRVYILFDGDDAGNSGAEELKPLIEECGYTVEIIKLPDGTDPGGMSDEDIQSIIEYTK